MKPESSLSYLQQHIPAAYLELDKLSSQLHILLL